LAELWPRFEASMIKHSVLSLLAYGAHTRLTLNQHVLSGNTGDPAPSVRRGLRMLRRRSARLQRALCSRYDARIAVIRGEHARACELFREHIAACEEQGYADEVERGRWALGQLIGGEEGQKLRDAAIQALSDLGYAQPLADMPTHYPELFTSRASGP
ncbi:MAG TPA: hypothetical protein VMF89_01125, partial [Polyangiales bacterium]|nr:hypothetical protein [Polyangiales bacterium]